MQDIYSLITAIFIGGAAGYLGSLMVTKRMALVGDALGHVALPGMGLALLFGLNVSVGAFILTGIDVNITKAKWYKLITEVGSFILTGISVIITKDSKWKNLSKNI